MASITWDNVTAFAPELSTVDAAAQTDILAHANAAFYVDAFDGEDGPALKLVRIFYAAHLGTMTGTGAAGGVVTSESAGGLSRSYAVGAGAGFDDLNLTAYGKTVRGMMRRYAGGPRVI